MTLLLELTDLCVVNFLFFAVLTVLTINVAAIQIIHICRTLLLSWSQIIHPIKSFKALRATHIRFTAAVIEVSHFTVFAQSVLKRTGLDIFLPDLKVHVRG